MKESVFLGFGGAMEHRTFHRILAAIIAVLIVLAGYGVYYVNDYHHAVNVGNAIQSNGESHRHRRRMAIRRSRHNNSDGVALFPVMTRLIGLWRLFGSSSPTVFELTPFPIAIRFDFSVSDQYGVGPATLGAQFHFA